MAFPIGSAAQEVVDATDPALPKSYAFREYRFPHPADSAKCSGASNATAALGRVTVAQTHVMEPGWPFFFLVADRPALLQAVVTGNGASPQVSVRASNGGTILGTLCLDGPAQLAATVDAATPRTADRFGVTLPAAWMRPGLSLEITAGGSVKRFAPSDLKLAMAPEINLIMLPMDLLDWNAGKPDVEPGASFLGDWAGAMPAARVRLGKVGARMAFPSLVVPDDADPVPVVLTTGRDLKGVPEMNVSAVALRYLSAFKRASGDYAWAFFYGNTENFFPGGWGGDKSFVGADFKGVFLHEMGHGLSLPHWGEGAFQDTAPGAGDYRYPYGGTTRNGGGRGETWNYYQNTNEFVSPICGLQGNAEFGKERSDAMQRTHWCEESRKTGRGPWDGFGDFSAVAIHRFLVGADRDTAGTVRYRGGDAPYHLSRQNGYPTLRLDGSGARVLERDPAQPAEKQDWERHAFLVPQRWDVPVYTVYGSHHPQHAQANLLYPPMAHIGNLPRILDPTDSATFAALAAGRAGPYSDYFYWPKDFTFKFTYADGSVLHALYPHENLDRKWKMGSGPWRFDLLYFALNIPADKKLARIELYRRPFVVRGANDTTAGNIANARLGITAKTFMSGATLILGRDVDVAPPGASLPPRAKGPASAGGLAYRVVPGGIEFTGIPPGDEIRIYGFRGARIASIPEAGGRAEWRPAGAAGATSGPGAIGFARSIRTGRVAYLIGR